MEMSNADRFFELVKWFNNFATQLNSLYNKISEIFAKEFKLKEIKRYVNYLAAMPWIPDVFHMGLRRDKEFAIHVMSIINKERLSSRAYDKIPSIIIARIEEKDGGYFGEEIWDIFSEENLTVKKTKDNFIKGEMRGEIGGIKFSAFQVDLELFSNKDAEVVIRREILPRAIRILE